MLIKLNKAQSTLEYALLITVVVGALLTMQSYMKRGVQGKLKQATDQIGEPYAAPGLTQGYERSTTTGTTNERYEGTAVATTSTASITSNSKKEMKPVHKEPWPATFSTQWQ